jgi:hypothetical protein
MTANDVQKFFKLRLRRRQAGLHVPDDVVQNTILAFATSPTTASGYAGASPTAATSRRPTARIASRRRRTRAVRHGLAGRHRPTFKAHDIRVSKRTEIVGRTNIEFAAEFLNAFKPPELHPVKRHRQQHGCRLSS